MILLVVAWIRVRVAVFTDLQLFQFVRVVSRRSNGLRPASYTNSALNVRLRDIRIDCARRQPRVGKIARKTAKRRHKDRRGDKQLCYGDSHVCLFKLVYVGKISDIMLDVRNGRIAYAVLSEGGFLGMGANLHAIPWSALTLDTDAKCFVVDIAAQSLKDDPGFDKDHWPTMADPQWGAAMYSYYNRQPYWSATPDVVESDPHVRPSC
jgi:PRC-barrel domain